MPKRIISAEEFQRMRTMRDNGATVGRLARIFGLPLEETRRLVDSHEQGEQVTIPSSSEEARVWLAEAALHLTTWPASAKSLRFVGSVLLRCLESDEGYQRLCAALGINTPILSRKRGQPRIPPETIEAICVMLKAGQAHAQIATTLDVEKSCVSRVNTKRNKLLQKWQRGAKPDKISLEEALKFAETIPREEVIAIFRAEISAEDIIPEEEKKIFPPKQ